MSIALTVFVQIMLFAVLIPVAVKTVVPKKILPILGTGIIVNILFSFFLFTISLVILSLITPSALGNHTDLIFKTILLIIVLLNLIAAKINGLVTAYKSKLLLAGVIAIACLPFLYFTQGGIRYHSSPDSHAFASTIGWFENNFSYSYLRNSYTSATGLNSADFYGQPTPILSSVWHIPDAQLRFTADNIFQVGRYTMPLFASFLGSITGEPNNFLTYMITFSVIGILMIAIVLLKIFNELKTIKSLANGLPITDNFLSKSSLINRFIPVITVVMTSISASVLVLEGSINQIWLFVVVLTYYWIGLTIVADIASNKQLSQGTFLKLVICSVWLSISYPNGTPLIMVISAVNLFAVVFVNWTVANKKNGFRGNSKYLYLKIFSSSLFALPGTLFLIKASFFLLTKNYFVGAPNQPYSLGAVPIDKLSISPWNGIGFVKNTGFGTGFSYNGELTINRALLPLLALLLIILIYAILIYLKNIKQIWILPYLAFSLILLVIPIRTLLIAQETFYPYQYLRNLFNVQVFCLPILFYIFSHAFSKILGGRMGKEATRILGFLGCLALLISFFTTNSKFKSVSEEFIILNEKNSVLNKSDTLTISNNFQHQAYSLTLFGSFTSLSDPWGPEIYPRSANDVRDLYEVDFSTRPITYKFVGKLNIKGKITGPVTLDQTFSSGWLVK